MTLTITKVMDRPLSTPFFNDVAKLSSLSLPSSEGFIVAVIDSESNTRPHPIQ